MTTSARRSIFITIVSANSLTLIGLASSMIIARILTPADLGAYAIAAVVMGLAAQFRDFGTSNYLVQTPEINTEILGRALGLTVLISFSLGILVLALAPFAASFYRAASVGQVLNILALNFFIVPFGANTLALLRREMRFKDRAIISHVSAVTGFTVSIAAALQGLGPISLALGTVAATLATTLAAARLRQKQYPWAIRFRNLGDVARHGATMTASTILSQINKGVIELVGGRFAGLEAVGFFNKAKSVTDQVSSILLGVANQVTLPLLAGWHRSGENIAPHYLRAVSLITGLAWPACVFSAVYPLEILHIMFGTQWDAAAPMLQLLSILGLIGSTFWLWTQALFAVGDLKSVAKGEAVLLISCLAVLAGLMHFGVKNLALASLLSTPPGLSYVYLILKRRLRFSHKEFFLMLSRSAGVTLCSLAGALGAHSLSVGYSDIPRVLIGMLFAGAAWLFACIWLAHPIGDEVRNAVLKIRSLRQRRDAPP